MSKYENIMTQKSSHDDKSLRELLDETNKEKTGQSPAATKDFDVSLTRVCSLLLAVRIEEARRWAKKQVDILDWQASKQGRREKGSNDKQRKEKKKK